MKKQDGWNMVKKLFDNQEKKVNLNESSFIIRTFPKELNPMYDIHNDVDLISRVFVPDFLDGKFLVTNKNYHSLTIESGNMQKFKKAEFDTTEIHESMLNFFEMLKELDVEESSGQGSGIVEEDHDSNISNEDSGRIAENSNEDDESEEMRENKDTN